MTEINRSIVDALVLGDEQAYVKVIDALYQPVYRFLLRNCRDSSTAEDLTQETFLAVWKGVASFAWRSTFKTWVFGIAYRQYLRYMDKKVIATVPLDEDRDEQASHNPTDELWHKYDQSCIREAIYSLPDLYREVICLIHLDGLCYREAAEVLEIPIGTVKSRMNSAFKLLREKLRRYEVQTHEVQQPESLLGRRT